MVNTPKQRTTRATDDDRAPTYQLAGHHAQIYMYTGRPRWFEVQGDRQSLDRGRFELSEGAVFPIRL